MKTLHGRCAGLDVHTVEIVACLRLVGKGKIARQVRRFSTTTQGLLELVGWLEDGRCTHVAMEAAGVYWKPVWHILDDGHSALILANAMHVKAVPRRKGDVNDATWLADLLAHGLIRASFVPPTPIHELRDLTRTRKQLTREIVQRVQRIQAVLEEANVKLSSVISDILGPSGRRILRAIIAGEADAEKLAVLSSERLGCGRAALSEALRGRIREHHRFLLVQHLRKESVAAFDARIADALAPFAQRLNEVPGLGRIAIETIIAEIGADMSPFPTPGPDQRQGSAASPRRRGLAHRRTTCVGREKTLSRQPAGGGRLAHLVDRHARRDGDRLRLPPVSPAQNRKAERKKRRAGASASLARRAPGNARTYRFGHQSSVARIAENGFATSGLSKSAKVVLTPCRASPQQFCFRP